MAIYLHGSNHHYICDGECYINNDGEFVQIMHEPWADSPREWDNLGHFYSLSGYSSPDKYSTYSNKPSEMDLIVDLGLEDEYYDQQERAEEAYEEYMEAIDLVKTYMFEIARYDCEMLRREFQLKVARYNERMYGIKTPLELEPIEAPVKPADMNPKKPTIHDPADYEFSWLIEHANRAGHVMLPVSVYDHSGVIYSVGDPTQFVDWQWDAGYMGVIYMTKDEIENNWGSFTDETRKRAIECLTSEVETYNAWANGNVYGFVITDKEGNEVDSCWGFYGDDADENGLADECGGLHDTTMNLDEWLELAEEVRNESRLCGLTAEFENYAA